MEKRFFIKLILIVTIIFLTGNLIAQEQRIKDLDFLIGKWKVREDIKDKNWWEESTRVGSYILDSTYIQIDATAISSSGKERTYLWYIHFNSKKKQFEMVSMFSNWHKVQFDILSWDPENLKLTIKNSKDHNLYEYHERYGEMIFKENLKEYVWTGQNKYGDPKNPGIWNYVEIGSREE